MIPIHPELRRVGFLKYVAAMREQGQFRLFPDLPLGKTGYFSDPFQKWFGRFLDKIEVKTPKTSFHSFRHNFRDAMREARITTDVVRALGG